MNQNNSFSQFTGPIGKYHNARGPTQPSNPFPINSSLISVDRAHNLPILSMNEPIFLIFPWLAQFFTYLIQFQKQSRLISPRTVQIQVKKNFFGGKISKKKSSKYKNKKRKKEKRTAKIRTTQEKWHRLRTRRILQSSTNTVILSLPHISPRMNTLGP